MRAISMLDMAATFYAAGLDPDYWGTALRHLRGAFGCDAVALAFLDEDNRAVDYYGDGDPAMVARYIGGYRSLDRVFGKVASGPVGRIWSDTMVDEDAPARGAGMRARCGGERGSNHCLQAIAVEQMGMRGLIALARSPQRPAFDGDDVDLLDTLLPHLGRATAAHLRLRSAVSSAECAMDCLGRLSYAVFVVGPGGSITTANMAAKTLLGGAAGIALRSDRIETASPQQARALDCLIGRAVRDPHEGGWIAIERADGRPAMRCLVTPNGSNMRPQFCSTDVAALLLIDVDPAPGGREVALSSLFGLTVAEAKVAERTLRGRSAPAIAAAMRLAPTTVRTHLKRAFEKTGTRGQTELGVLVSRLAADRSSGRGAADMPAGFARGARPCELAMMDQPV